MHTTGFGAAPEYATIVGPVNASIRKNVAV